MRLEIFPWTTSPRPHFSTFLFAVRLPSKMKVLSCTFIFVVTLALSECSSSSSTQQVLKFGNTVQDYVMFSPNMTYFTSQFSLCSWVKKLRTGDWRYWLFYSTTSSSHEIIIRDHGYSQIFSRPYLYKVNQLDFTLGTWYHYCMCWSSSSKSADVYYNGRKRGSMKTDSGRSLDTGGVLVLGQYQSPYGRISTGGGNRYTFGGELFKLNIFAKKFTAAEVRAMYKAGIFSEAEKIHGSYRRLTWESILQQTRHGNVQLVDLSLSCSLIGVENKLAVTQRELETTQSELETTQSELETAQSELETTQSELEEIRTKLEETVSDLDETQNELKETKTQLALYSRNSTRSVLPVLKFGTTVGDYIMFSPNMEPFTEQFSLCSWVRKLKTDGYPYWISYATEDSNSEIGINVQGLSNIFNDIDKLDWRRHLDITPGTWHHYCMCWSYPSRTANIYFNGVKAGSITTPLERRLDTGGSLVLGQYQREDGEILTKHGNRYTFGGELLKLNMFSKKFSDEEVRAMFQAGVCSDIEDTHESYRLLTWESIIEQPRRGNVELVDPVISCTSAGEETVSEMTGEEITTHN